MIDIDLVAGKLPNDSNIKKVNIKIIAYPDGTKSHVLEFPKLCPSDYTAIINYYYESPVDYLDIVSIVTTLKEQHFIRRIELIIYYMPNARMDRVKNRYETFTLKAFTSLINSLPIDSVYVFDPHSPVSELLLDKATMVNKETMDKALITTLNRHISNELGSKKLYIAFPDVGAQKRYMDIIDRCSFKNNILGIFIGEKIRDWATGKIIGVKVKYNGDNGFEDNVPIVIIDDICSKGGTFKSFIRAIQNRWVKDFNYYLYVSHLEPAVLEGDLLKDGSLNLLKILTTDSLKYLWMSRGLDIEKHEKIQLLIGDKNDKI